MTIDDPTILVVDDCTHDALLMRMVFERSGLVKPLRFARSGEEAMAYLGGVGAFGDRNQFPMPDVVLLDLNMPGKNGFEVLEWIRQQAGFRQLLVHILSASSRTEDIRRAYASGANAYLVKPGNLDGLQHLARRLIEWLKLVQLPPAAAGNSRRLAWSGNASPVEAGAKIPAHQAQQIVASENPPSDATAGELPASHGNRSGSMAV